MVTLGSAYYNYGYAFLNGVGSTADALNFESSAGVKQFVIEILKPNMYMAFQVGRNSVPQFTPSSTYIVDGLTFRDTMLLSTDSTASPYNETAYEYPAYRTVDNKPVFNGFTVFDPYDVV
jgi:hypothetical protein